MKRLIAAVSLAGMVLAVASTSLAAPYGAGGCGLGSVIFKDQPGGVQIFAATTNGTFGNQTFGITTGTLNCGDPIWAYSNSETKRFVAHNMDALAMDIAQGKGETLDAFAELLQVPAENRAEFAAVLQENFDQVFTSEKVVMADVIDNVVTVTN
jgi:hypothetical protein